MNNNSNKNNIRKKVISGKNNTGARKIDVMLTSEIGLNIKNQIIGTDSKLTMIDSGAAISVCPKSYRTEEVLHKNKKTRYLLTATGQKIVIYGKNIFRIE